MKKLLILIFLFQTFPSVGSPIDKGLVCKCEVNCFKEKINNFMIFYFSKNNVLRIKYKYYRDKVFRRKFTFDYVLSPKTIEIKNHGNLFYSVSRETLKFISGNVKFQCDVFGRNQTVIEENKIVKNLQKIYDSKLMKNKI